MRGRRVKGEGEAGLLVLLLFHLLRGGGVQRLDLGVGEFAVMVFVEGLDIEIGTAGEIFADGFEFGAVDFAVRIEVELLDELGGGGVFVFLAVALGGGGGRGEDEGAGGENKEEAFHGLVGFGLTTGSMTGEAGRGYWVGRG